MNALKRPMTSIRRFCAALLCIALMFEGMGMQVLAGTVDVNDAIVKNDVIDELDVSNGGVGTTDGDISNGDTSPGDVTSGNLGEYMASGTYCDGVTWTLTEDGLLTVQGTANPDLTTSSSNYTRGWEDYAEDILSAKVSAKGIKRLSRFFDGCVNLTEIDFTGFDTSSATSMASMFNGCSSLTKLDVTGFQTSNVVNMEFMFAECKALTVLDVSNFDTSKVKHMNHMFYSCRKLTSLDLGGFDCSQLTCTEDDHYALDYMLDSCSALEWVIVPQNINSNFSQYYVEADLPKTMYSASKTSLEHLPTGIITDNVKLWIDWEDAGMVTDASELPEGSGLLASGKYCEGVTWTLSEQGELLIEGTAEPNLGRAKYNYYRGWCFSPYVENVKTVKITAKGIEYVNNLFSGCSNMTSIDVSQLDTSKLWWTRYMFFGCSSLTTIDISGWDTGKIYDMVGMFEGCTSLESINLSGVDVSNVLTTSSMFSNCAALKTLDLSGFDWSKTDSIEETIPVLDGCISLTTLKTPLNLQTKVELPHVMYDASGTEYSYLPKNMSTSVLLTKEKTEVLYSGTYCEGVTWTLTDTGVLTVTGTADSSLDSGTQNYTAGWKEYADKIVSAKVNVKGIKNFNGFFEGCQNLTSVDFTGTDTSNAISMRKMFYNCTALTSLDLSNFDCSKITVGVSETNNSTEGFLYGCNSLQWIAVPQNIQEGVEFELPYEMFTSSNSEKYILLEGIYAYTRLWKNWEDAELVTDGSRLPEDSGLIACGKYCEGVTWTLSKEGELVVEGIAEPNQGRQIYNYCNGWSDNYAEYVKTAKINVQNVECLSYFLAYCSNLKTVDLSELDTSNVQYMNSLFNGCSSLKTIDLSGFDTRNATRMQNMFHDCSSLETIDLSNFYTGNVTKMNEMFAECSSLENLDLSNFDIRSVTQIYNMFVGCSNLKSLNLSSFDCINLENDDSEEFAGWFEEFLTGCDKLETIDTPINLKQAVDLPHKMYDSQGTEYGKLPKDRTESITLVKEFNNTNDGDNPAPGTGDGNDKPIVGTEDGNDKPNTGTNDGNDVFHDEIIGEFKVSFVRNHVYTGKAIKPEVIVTFGTDTLVEGVDYTVSYKNNVNAAAVGSNKAPTIIVKGKGNYDSSQMLEFNILAKEMTADNTTVSEMISLETGKTQTVKPVVSVGNKKLKANQDYEILYPDNGDGAYEKPGTYNIVIKGKGNYQGSVAATMTILNKNQIMASKLKVGKIAAVDYVEGEPATPTPEVSYKGTKLELGKDYAISYKNNNQAGKATLIITGLKNAEGTYVAGSVQKTFVIKGTALKKAKASYETKVRYTGSAICPEITLKDGEKTLRPNIDYTVAYAKNINVGKGTIVLTGKGGYTGTVKKTFTIEADTSVVEKLTINFADGKTEAAYNQKGAKPAISVVLGDVILKNGKDYTISYKNNKKLADASATKKPTVVIKGKGNYKFTKEVNFVIVEKMLSDSDISVVAADKFVGDKKGYLSAPVVKDGNGKKLKINKDYKVIGYSVNGAAFEGSGDVAAGTVVTVAVEGMNNYKGRVETTYRVANKNISKVKTNKPKLEYNGSSVVFTEEMLVAGKLELTDKSSNRKLVYGVDFVVVGYQKNAKKGTATVTVQGIGEYGGTKNVKFSIVSKALKKN